MLDQLVTVRDALLWVAGISAFGGAAAIVLYLFWCLSFGFSRHP